MNYMTEQQINTLAKEGRDLFEEDYKKYLGKDYPNGDLRGFFDEAIATAQACEDCQFYQCKNYSKEASKKLEAMKNVIQALKDFFAGEITLSEAKIRLDMECRSMKECVMWEDQYIVDKCEEECLAWQWPEGDEEDSDYDENDEENMNPYIKP